MVERERVGDKEGKGSVESAKKSSIKYTKNMPKRPEALKKAATAARKTVFKKQGRGK